MSYIAVPFHCVPDDFRDWLESLTLEQRRELGALDHAWSMAMGDVDKYHIREITRDWIEENGGQRNWWGSITHDFEGTS